MLEIVKSKNKNASIIVIGSALVLSAPDAGMAWAPEMIYCEETEEIDFQ